MQIRNSDDIIRRARPDAIVYDPDPMRSQNPASFSVAQAGELVMDIPTLIAKDDVEETAYRAIAVYEASKPREYRGTPDAWIELLSPSNKPTGRNFDTYFQKRTDILLSGVVFVEIDFLHKQPPTFPTLANYAASPLETDAFPYRIAVIDPRPNLADGEGRVRQFGVDDPIPTLPIPLNDSDVIEFDFNEPYQQMFSDSMYGNDVDYSQLPPDFDAYSPADQTRIAARMLAVLQASRSGVDLETQTVTPAAVTLDTALEQLNPLLSDKS